MTSTLQGMEIKRFVRFNIRYGKGQHRHLLRLGHRFCGLHHIGHQLRYLVFLFRVHPRGYQGIQLEHGGGIQRVFDFYHLAFHLCHGSGISSGQIRTQGGCSGGVSPARRVPDRYILV